MRSPAPGDAEWNRPVRSMVTLSLLVNLVVLIPVCAGLIADADWIRAGYGPATAARGILLSVYLAIGLVSALLLVVREPNSVVALLAVQVVYKLTTPLTVGTLHHPVVVSNLAIAALHSITIVSVWRARASVRGGPAAPALPADGAGRDRDSARPG